MVSLGELVTIYWNISEIEKSLVIIFLKLSFGQRCKNKMVKNLSITAKQDHRQWPLWAAAPINKFFLLWINNKKSFSENTYIYAENKEKKIWKEFHLAWQTHTLWRNEGYWKSMFVTPDRFLAKNIYHLFKFNSIRNQEK